MTNRLRVWVVLACIGLGLLCWVNPAAAEHSMIYGSSLGQDDGQIPPLPLGSILGPPGEDVLNVLLLGSDTTNPVNAGRTDVLMIVSVNLTRNTVNLLSIPRDLYVYIPEAGMQRINTAYGLGENNGHAGGGYGLLSETIQYNLGLAIDHYARVDFNDFQALIDALGGIELTVPCALQDWQLKSPELDPVVEENWQLVTLPAGVQQLDGYEALWYARSRRTSSDFDRGRRQQDLIRAIWQKANTLGLTSQLAVLWGDLRQMVHTDMDIDDLIPLIPVALTLDMHEIAHFRFEPGIQVQSWMTPNGEAVLLPQREMLETLMRHFMQPVTDNRLDGIPPRVEILNATGYAGMDRVAADLLRWEGFVATPAGDAPSGYAPRSVVYDYAPSQKGHQLPQLLDFLRLDGKAEIVTAPNADREVDFRVILGGDFRACQFNVMAPLPTEIP